MRNSTHNRWRTAALALVWLHTALGGHSQYGISRAPGRTHSEPIERSQPETERLPIVVPRHSLVDVSAQVCVRVGVPSREVIDDGLRTPPALPFGLTLDLHPPFVEHGLSPMCYSSLMFIAIILTAIVAFIHKLLVLVQCTYMCARRRRCGHPFRSLISVINIPHLFCLRRYSSCIR